MPVRLRPSRASRVEERDRSRPRLAANCFAVSVEPGATGSRGYLRRINPRLSGAGEGSAQERGSARLRSLEPMHAWIQRARPTFAGFGRCTQRRLPISRSRCLGCDTNQTVALDVVRRPKTTQIHELERYMRCKDCSRLRGYPYKRSHLVALRQTKISANDPPTTWWPGER
jgi:hypothetical protein